MNAVMKSVRCIAPGELEFADRPAPGSPREGWALIDVAHVGICGTDYHIFEGKHPFLAYPRVMGHEVSGTVVEINGPAAISCRSGRHHQPLPVLRKMRRVPAGKAELLCLDPGAGRASRRRDERAAPRSRGEPVARLEACRSVEAATVEFLAVGAHAVRRSMGRWRSTRIGDRRGSDRPWHRTLCANRETTRDHHGRQRGTAGLCRAAARASW